MHTPIELSNKVHICFMNYNHVVKNTEHAPTVVSRKIAAEFGPEHAPVKSPFGAIQTPIDLDPKVEREAALIEYARKYKENLKKTDPMSAELMVIRDPISDSRSEAILNEAVQDTAFKLNGLWKAKEYEKLGNVLRHLKGNISHLENTQVYNLLLELAKTRHKDIEAALADDFNQLIFLAELAIEKGFIAKDGKLYYDSESGSRKALGTTVEDVALWLQNEPLRKEYLESKLTTKLKSRPEIPSVTEITESGDEIEVEVFTEKTPEERVEEAIEAGVKLGLITPGEKGWYEVSGLGKKRKADLVAFYLQNELELRGLESVIKQAVHE